MKNSKLIITAFFLAAGILFSSCSIMPKEEQTMSPPLIDAGNVTYDTVKVKKGNIVNSININANFVSAVQQDVSFTERSGYLSQINVQVGQAVKKGDIIAKLDTAELEKQIEKQVMLVDKANIIYESKYRKRHMFYYVKDKDDPIMYCDEEGNTFTWDARLDLDDEVNLAKIDYNLALEQLHQYNQELEKCTITAPIDGTIVYMSAEGVGEYIAARRTFVTIADPNKMQLKYTGEKLNEFELGISVIADYDGNKYNGKVVMTPANLPEDALEDTKKYIKIQLQNSPQNAKIGENSAVELIKEQKNDVIVIPQNAIQKYAGQMFVNVLENGIKKERVIETGIVTPTDAEVIKGLNIGEELIIG